MEHRTETDPIPVRSHDIPPPDGSCTNSTPGSHYPTPTSTEDLVLKRAINYWQGPRHPTYNSLSARLQSFKNWPHSEAQTPEALSEAGFYYDAWIDQTICFHCGGMLSEWLLTDDVWHEHGKCFPYCVYVRHLKGALFARECARLVMTTECD